MTPRDRRIWAGFLIPPVAYETYTIVRGEGALSDVLRWAGHTHTPTGRAATWVVIAATAFWLGWHLTAGVADVIDALDGLHDVEERA